MSRAVSDLATIRRFLAFGVVFLIVNLTTFVVGVIILLTLSWQLGLIVAALAIPLVALCYLYEAKYQTLARRSQDQVGDLATMVEESVLGIRILKAFGRSSHLTRRFLIQASELRATEIGKARVVAKLWAVIIALPEIAFGLTLFLGLQQVADGELSAGALVAFFGVALGLRWPIDSIGWLLAMSNDAASASLASALTERCMFGTRRLVLRFRLRPLFSGCSLFLFLQHAPGALNDLASLFHYALLLHNLDTGWRGRGG